MAVLSRLSWQRRRKRKELELSIRPTPPWWVRWLPTLGLLALIPLGALMLPYVLSRFGISSTTNLAIEVRTLRASEAGLRSALQASQQQLAIEARTRQQDQAARESLAQELAALREENVHLKEDLASLRSLGVNSVPGGVQLSGFTLRAGAMPGEYRWHLLVAQDGRQTAPFTGNVRLRLEEAAGGTATSTAGTALAAEPAQPVTFKYYQDVEGELRINPGQHASRVWAEVWRDGARAPAASVSLVLP